MSTSTKDETRKLNTTTNIPKNLPLKKRRAFMVEAENNNSAEDDDMDQRSTLLKPHSITADDPLRLRLPSPSSASSTPGVQHISPTQQSSPSIHFDQLMRQHYAYLLHAAATGGHTPPSGTSQSAFLPSFDHLMIQQFLDTYRALLEQAHTYTKSEDDHRRADSAIDEHFRKSLGENYEKMVGTNAQIAGGFLTPATSGSSASSNYSDSTNSSPVDRTPVDSIEEHFARSLGKLWPLSTTTTRDAEEIPISVLNTRKMSIDQLSSSSTDSVIDDHFSKALGQAQWKKLKDKS